MNKVSLIVLFVLNYIMKMDTGGIKNQQMNLLKNEVYKDDNNVFNPNNTYFVVSNLVKITLNVKDNNTLIRIVMVIQDDVILKVILIHLNVVLDEIDQQQQFTIQNDITEYYYY